MAEVWIMGEMIVEIMRIEDDKPLDKAELFRGPYPSGAPAIFIDTVARLGHSAGIIGGVGNDDFGKCLLDRMTKDGVDCSQVLKSDTCATGVAFVTYFGDGSRQFIFHMGNTPAAEAIAPDKSVIEGVKYFHIMGCSLSAKPEFAIEILKTMKLAKSVGAKISFDPNIRKDLLSAGSSYDIIKEVVANTNILMPGVEELLLITGKETIEEAVEVSFENPELELLTLKNGSKGCTVYTRENVYKQGVYFVPVIDATGAGDSFDGAFICGLLEGKSIEETLQMATAAGALNTMAFGPMEGDISLDNIRNIKKKTQVLGIDIGGTSAKYGYVSFLGEITNKSYFDTSSIKSIEEFLEALYEVVSSGVKEGITSIGISSLGIFDASGMCLGGVENLSFLQGVNLKECIETQFPNVTCQIINDGVAATMGEYWLGEGQGCKNFICMTLGTGIGGAIVIDGVPLLGSHFQSGEIGYTNYQSESDYLEVEYSTKGVLEKAACLLEINEIDGLEFVERVKKEDVVCAKIFDEWMDQIAGMLANSILLLDPEKVILGGGISGQKEWICDALNKKLQMRLPEAFRGKALVRWAKNGNDAGLLGAAQAFHNHR